MSLKISGEGVAVGKKLSGKAPEGNDNEEKFLLAELI